MTTKERLASLIEDLDTAIEAAESMRDDAQSALDDIESADGAAELRDANDEGAVALDRACERASLLSGTADDILREVSQ